MRSEENGNAVSHYKTHANVMYAKEAVAEAWELKQSTKGSSKSHSSAALRGTAVGRQQQCVPAATAATWEQCSWPCCTAASEQVRAHGLANIHRRRRILCVCVRTACTKAHQREEEGKQSDGLGDQTASRAHFTCQIDPS